LIIVHWDVYCTTSQCIYVQLHHDYQIQTWLWIASRIHRD